MSVPIRTALATFSWRIYRLIGFRKVYNFLLWCIFALSLLGFSLSRAPFLNYHGVFCGQDSRATRFHAAPGECFYFLNGRREQVGMMMHLYGIIPCCSLLFFQFVPTIRQRAVLFHRINGYIVIVLLSLAIVGAFMALRTSFGGNLAFQVSNVVLGAWVLVGLSLAILNARRLQIEEHRAWMLRAWVSACSVITMRIIQSIAGRMISGQGYIAMRPCAQIDSDGLLAAAAVEHLWPECADYFTGQNPSQQVVVTANYFGLPIEVNVAISTVSGASAFLAMFLHALGIEIYLYLTAAESECLRQISSRRQLAAGMMHSGCAGAIVDRLGLNGKADVMI